MVALSIEEMHENASAAENLLKSLANANRLMILCHLVHTERSVSDLEQLVNLSQSALSQHLARLKAQDIVSSRKEGTTAYYAIKSPHAVKVLELIYSLYCQ
ncbi:MAG: ArsR family transcriptional regulator [Halomonadaceae bacterium]|nr:MAG: ArsR family transcriptional regulator [Halomonadaceae bacterium]